MFVLALQNPILRSLAAHAVGVLREPCVEVPPLTPAARLSSAARRASLIVHDFCPDASQSVAWLAETTALCPSLGIFALLGSPAGPVLGFLLRISHFRLSGAAVGAEERARTLAPQLSDARGACELSGLGRLMGEAWDLPLSLRRLVHGVAADPRHHSTVSALLRDVGLSRKTFVHQAERAGFVPPLRFLQVTRVLGATLVLERGSTTESAAEYLGYASAETMRRHFLAIYGAPPRVARAVGVATVTERIRERLRGAARLRTGGDEQFTLAF